MSSTKELMDTKLAGNDVSCGINNILLYLCLLPQSSINFAVAHRSLCSQLLLTANAGHSSTSTLPAHSCSQLCKGSQPVLLSPEAIFLLPCNLPTPHLQLLRSSSIGSFQSNAKPTTYKSRPLASNLLQHRFLSWPHTHCQPPPKPQILSSQTSCLATTSLPELATPACTVHLNAWSSSNSH
jgi:hypothetical protein